MYEVRIVCSGNTCRSPMAAALLTQELQTKGLLERVAVESCGVGAFPGEGATLGAQRAMQERGLDISGHRSQRFGLPCGADLILTMTTGHKKILLQELPELAGRVYTLKEYATDRQDNSDLNVSDPYGGDDAVYRETAAEIQRFIARAAERMAKEL